MENYLPPLWIAFPSLRPERGRKQEHAEYIGDLYRLLLHMPPDELPQYKEDHPPPPGWEGFYESASRLHKWSERLPGVLANYALIEKMWRVTTLK